ncbi:MAG: KEOPS complex subunit Cgi121 [Methanoregula sp.]|nr:KEOPS complex subunit Cgi121 [Methanoregula sp.]
MKFSIDGYEIRQAKTTVDNRDDFLQTIKGIAQQYSTHIICFDADRMAGREHAESAIQHALRSFLSAKPISNSFEMEALLFASGSRQCNAATSFGIHAGKNTMFVCICPVKEGVWKELAQHMHFIPEKKDTWTPKKVKRLMTLFDITQNELELVGIYRLKDLILERIALLEVSR